MYEHGVGTKRNRPMAMSIYRDLTAQKGHFSGMARERLEMLNHYQ